MVVSSERGTLESDGLGSNPSCQVSSFCATLGPSLDFSELVSSLESKVKAAMPIRYLTKDLMLPGHCLISSEYLRNFCFSSFIPFLCRF